MGGAERRRPAFAQVVEIRLARLDAIVELGVAGVAPRDEKIDRQADAREWWPLLLWSLGAAFVLLYPIERTHDTRLIWLGIITVVAGCAAYGVTSDQIDRKSLHDAAEYWPLLLSVVGIGLLPLAFRRRIG